MKFSFTVKDRGTEDACNNHFRKIGAEKRVQNFQKLNFRINTYSLKEDVNFPVEFLDRPASSSNIYLKKGLIH